MTEMDGLLRARRVLAEMAAEQDQLGAELNASGLTSFVDRSEWLIAHRTPLEALAWEIREAKRQGFRSGRLRPVISAAWSLNSC